MGKNKLKIKLIGSFFFHTFPLSAHPHLNANPKQYSFLNNNDDSIRTRRMKEMEKKEAKKHEIYTFFVSMMMVIEYIYAHIHTNIYLCYYLLL